MDNALYLLEEGQVEVVDSDTLHVKPANVIRSGHFFGERASILSQPRSHGVRAISSVQVWSLDAKFFIDLIVRYPIFSQSFSSILRDKHGIFLPMDHFKTEVLRGLSSGFLNMDKLLPLYMDLHSALHPLVLDPQAIDLGALLYAQRRLPENTTSTFAWFLTDEIPSSYRQPERFFTPMVTSARRRGVWEMRPGKNMVLLRTGMTDILDLITNLCLFAVEAKKLRLRLNDPEVLHRLQTYISQSINSQEKDTSPEDIFQFLETLPYSKAENEGLIAIWGALTPRRLWELALHHEDFVVVSERQIDNYNSRQTEKWIMQITRGVSKLLGVDPGELTEDWEVHVISSNTHSVVNCLSPHWQALRSTILEWAKGVNHRHTLESWADPQDLIYSLIPDFLAANPKYKPDPKQNQAWGILNLEDLAHTGIQVQLIDLSKLEGLPRDPALPKDSKTKHKLIVNVDYAFGEQAEEIFRNLITLFQHRLRSFSVMGKAGTLVGKRGDILLPDSFLNQTHDQILPLVPWPSREIQSLKNGLPSSVVIHQGPLLTVEGTLLQNQSLLQFYKNLWKAVGIEMEGWYFAQQIQQARRTNHLVQQVRERYGYYVSDNPLELGSNLSTPMTAVDGIPPLYSLTRHFIKEILNSSAFLL